MYFFILRSFGEKDQSNRYCDWDTSWTSEESWIDSIQEQKIFIFFSVLAPSVGPIQIPVGTGGFFPKGKAAGGLGLITHRRLVARLRNSGIASPLPHVPSWRA
jgi:hypothetical protein